MRLLCLNAWGGRLGAPLLDYLAANDPDLLCLQEVTRALGPGPAVQFYHGADKAEPLEQRADLLADVAGVLRLHRGWFCPAMRGVLRDAEGREHASEFGLATFVRQGLIVEAEAEGFVHGAFRASGWGAPPVPRVAQVIRLTVPGAGSGGGAVTIAQMHGLRDPAGKQDTPARTVQVARLMALLAQVRQPMDAVIVCGDFNLLPDSETFAVLRRAGLQDLVTARGYSDTRTSHYRKPERHADYMLVSAGVDVRRFEVVEAPEVSDHRPLLLEFEQHPG